MKSNQQSRKSTLKWFIFGRLVSEFGDRSLIITLPLIALSLGTGVYGVAVLLVASQAPLIVALYVVGKRGSGVSLRRAMLVSDGVQFLCQTGTFVAVAAGTRSIWLIAVLQAASACAAAVPVAVVEASVATLSSRENLQKAYALFGTGRSVVQVVAPGVAGVLVVTMGVESVCLIDALTFLVSIGVLSLLKFPASAYKSVTSRIAWSIISRKRWLVASSLGAAVINGLCVAPVLVLGPGILSRSKWGLSTWGATMAVFGFGAVLGGLLAVKKHFDNPLVAAFTVAPMVVLFPLALAVKSQLFAVDLAAFIAGIQSSLFNSLNQTARQRGLDPQSRVQGAAFASVLAFGMNPLGFFLAAFLGSRVGASAVLWGAASVGLLAPVMVLAWSSRDSGSGPSQLMGSGATGMPLA